LYLPWGRSVHSASHFIRAAFLAALIVVLALTAILVPAKAHAQSGSGFTCTVINGVNVCTDGQTSSSGTVNCVTDSATGAQTCYSPSTGTTTTGGSGALGLGLGGSAGQPTQSSSTGWLSKLTGWIAYAINAVFTALIQLLKDLVTYILGVVLSVVEMAISAIPVPDFIANNSMGSLLGQTGPIVGFFMTELNIGQALTLVGAGYAFRLLRKFLTLFQW
jgi:hypothetical protein